MLGDPLLTFIHENFKGGVALDIGANHGLYTVPLASIAERVFAFEPIPDAAQDLRLRGLPNVTVIQTAVSDKEGRTTLHVDTRPDQLGVASSLARLSGMEAVTTPLQVSTVSIDAFCIANRVRPSLIKIDVEGHEFSVVKGGLKTIIQYQPVLIFEFWETWWKIGKFDLIFDWLSPLYHLTVIQTGENARKIYGNETRPFRNGVSVDIGCVPKPFVSRLLGRLTRRYRDPVRSA